MAILFFDMNFQVLINVSLSAGTDPVFWNTLVTAVVAFYFGSRS
jgi:hypothetical protein